MAALRNASGMQEGEITLLNSEFTVIECETLRGFHPSAAGLSPAPGNESKNPRGASFSLGVILASRANGQGLRPLHPQ
ncbi:hypothetical protein [Candidatus Binatus sp.]|uniref:hypothetical protein n=1 Tax=Candidatus Binatus sp. TaxID=2811406 RepID=UPI002F95DEB7